MPLEEFPETGFLGPIPLRSCQDGAAKRHVHPRRLTAVELSEHLPGPIEFPFGAQFRVQKPNKLKKYMAINPPQIWMK